LFIFIGINLIPLTGEIILIIMPLSNVENTVMAVDKTRNIGNLIPSSYQTLKG